MATPKRRDPLPIELKRKPDHSQRGRRLARAAVAAFHKMLRQRPALRIAAKRARAAVRREQIAKKRAQVKPIFED
jgi:hypothetical protein